MLIVRNGCTFLFQNFDQPLEHAKQLFAGADFQTGRNESRIVDEVAGAVSDDASDREAEEFLAHVFRIPDHQPDILAPELNRFFVTASVLIVQFVAFSDIAGVGLGGRTQFAILTVSSHRRMANWIVR